MVQAARSTQGTVSLKVNESHGSGWDPSCDRESSPPFSDGYHFSIISAGHCESTSYRGREAAPDSGTSADVFKLRLFGTPNLEGPAGVVPPPGPRRLAVLASLAAAGTVGLTRDKLVARLWPDMDDDRARRNLSQLLYAMRSELGTELVEGTGTVRLDPAQCWSDVTAFDAAIAEHHDAAAVELYSGPFLDGFHLTESPEFSQWVDGERDRLAATARTAAVRVADMVPSSDTRAAAAAWQRAVLLDPLNGQVVIRHVDALAADGDRVGAIRAADQYAARVRTELEAEPDAIVVRRADVLRRAHAESPAKSARVGATDGAATAAASGVAPSTTSTAASSPAASPKRRQAFAMGATAVAIVVAILAWSQRAPAALGDNEFVLLAEFANHTSDSLLTRSVGTAVAAALQQSAHVVPLPRSRVARVLRRMERPDTTERLNVELAREVAQREGVRLVLSGDVIESGSVRQIISRILEAQTGRVLSTRTFRVTSEADLLPSIDRLAAAMRRDLGEAASIVAEAVPLPDVTTRSLPALYYYAEGIDAMRRTDDALASHLFERAVGLDSNFASAHAQLGALRNANNDVPRATFHFRRALAQVDRLPLDESLRIQIAAAYARGELELAANLSQRYVELRPRDVGGWNRLGFYLFTAGQGEESRAAYARADQLAPLTATSLMNVGTSWLSQASRTGEVAHYDSARAYYERAITMQPSFRVNTFYNQQYGEILLGAGHPDSARATFDLMLVRGPADRARGLRSNAFLDAMQGKWRTAAARLAEAAEISVAGRQWTSAMRNDALRADLLLTMGDGAGAAASLRRGTAIALREQLETRAIAFIALAQVKAGNRAAAAQLLERMRAASRPEHSAEQVALLTVEGALHLAAGRAAPARTALEAAFVRDSSNPQTGMLLARALAAAGADSAAAELLTRTQAVFHFGVEGQFDGQFALYERGRALERLGRTEEAVEAYRRVIDRYPVGSTDAEPLALKDARQRLKGIENRR